MHSLNAYTQSKCISDFVELNCNMWRRTTYTPIRMLAMEKYHTKRQLIFKDKAQTIVLSPECYETAGR